MQLRKRCNCAHDATWIRAQEAGMFGISSPLPTTVVLMGIPSLEPAPNKYPNIGFTSESSEGVFLSERAFGHCPYPHIDFTPAPDAPARSLSGESHRGTPPPS